MSVDVLHVINGLDVGGAERSLTNLLGAGLADGGSHGVTHGVVSLQDAGAFGSELASAGVPLWTLGMRRGIPTPAALARLRGVVRKAQPRLLQGWMYHSNLAAALVRPRKSILCWNIRQTLESLTQEKPLTRWVVRANRALVKRAAVVIYNSRTAQQQHARLGFAASHSTVIANGVDTERFQPNAEFRSDLRKELSIPQDAPVIGHAARYHPMKNHAGFFSAAAQVAQRHPDAHILVAGPGVDADNSTVRELAQGLNPECVHLLGERHDMPRVLAALDVLCSSSAWGEGFPNVVAEAMASGVQCVVTDVGASAELVGDTGAAVPVVDARVPVDALANALAQMLAAPPEERRAAGLRARERVLQHFGLQRCVSAYQDLYASLLG